MIPGLLWHGGQREELIVDRHPDHIARAGTILSGGYARRAGKPVGRKVAPTRLVGLRAIVPQHPPGQGGVTSPHGRGSADHPFLGRQGKRLRRAVLQPHSRGDQVVRGGLKLLHDAQAIGEQLLGTHSSIGLGQREDPVPLHRLAVEQRQSRRGGERIQRGQVIGRRLLVVAPGDRFRIMDQFDQLQAAAIRGEGVTRIAVRHDPQLLLHIDRHDGFRSEDRFLDNRRRRRGGSASVGQG